MTAWETSAPPGVSLRLCRFRHRTITVRSLSCAMLLIWSIRSLMCERQLKLSVVIKQYWRLDPGCLLNEASDGIFNSHQTAIMDPFCLHTLPPTTSFKLEYTFCINVINAKITIFTIKKYSVRILSTTLTENDIKPDVKMLKKGVLT